MRELSLYVSASAEMDPECELLGQMLAQLTPSVRWRITRTPTSHQQMDSDWGALENADAYVILVGKDITAPIGVEWRAAREWDIPTHAYRSILGAPSPALSAFVRQASDEWHTYASPQAFVAHYKRSLIKQLIDGTPGYGLSLEEIESLAAELQESGIQPTDDSGEERRGAGRGGIILPNTHA